MERGKQVQRMHGCSQLPRASLNQHPIFGVMGLTVILMSSFGPCVTLPAPSAKMVARTCGNGSGISKRPVKKAPMKRSCAGAHAFCSAWLLLLLVLCSLLLRPTDAQFGVAKAKGKIKELLLQHQADLAAKQTASAEVDVNGEAQANPTQGILSPKDAADMEEILIQASQDEETMKMVVQMKVEMKDEIEALGAETSEDILRGMLHQLVEMRFLEVLFKDPERAVEESIKEGLIEDKKKIKEYKKNPALLEADMRKGLYFSFISLAVAGGYI